MQLKNKHFSSYFLFWNSYLDVLVYESNSIFCLDNLLDLRASQVALLLLLSHFSSVKKSVYQCSEMQEMQVIFNFKNTFKKF